MPCKALEIIIGHLLPRKLENMVLEPRCSYCTDGSLIQFTSQSGNHSATGLTCGFDFNHLPAPPGAALSTLQAIQQYPFNATM